MSITSYPFLKYKYVFWGKVSVLGTDLGTKAIVVY